MNTNWKYSKDIYAIGRSVRMRPFSEIERKAVVSFIRKEIEIYPPSIRFVSRSNSLDHSPDFLLQDDFCLGRILEKIGRDFKRRRFTEQEEGYCDRLIYRTGDRRYLGYSIPVSDEEFMRMLSIRRKAPYLYEVTYDDSMYGDDSYWDDFKLGGCSSIRCGNFYGRNYDWTYDERAEFIVRVNKNGRIRHSSIGVASHHTPTEEEVQSGIYLDAYRYMPFTTVDGINDAGVVCSMNVVPTGDDPAPQLPGKNLTTGTNPEGRDVCAICLARYILDNADSVEDAIRLAQSANIWTPSHEGKPEELHYMIADDKRTVAIEFIHNRLEVIDDWSRFGGIPAMTNFYLHGYDGETGNLFVGESVNGTLTPHAMGMERYRILRNGSSSADNREGMTALMKSIRYTKAYDIESDDTWYSECAADYGSELGDITVSTPASGYSAVIAAAARLFAERNRKSGLTWQTVHTSIYDVSSKSLTVFSQEDDDEFTVSL